MRKSIWDTAADTYQDFRVEIIMAAISVVAASVARQFNECLLGRLGCPKDIALGIYFVFLFLLFIAGKHIFELIKSRFKGIDNDVKKTISVSCKVENNSLGIVILENHTNFDFIDIYAEIVGVGGNLDPRYVTPPGPVRMNILSAIVPHNETDVWEGKSRIMLWTAMCNKQKGYCAFTGKENSVKFVGTGQAKLKLSGKLHDGKRFVRMFQVTVTPRNNRIADMDIIPINDEQPNPRSEQTGLTTYTVKLHNR